MSHPRLIDGETEPERLGEFPTLETARIAAAVLWLYPQVQATIRHHAGSDIRCFILFSPAFARYYTVITDLDFARQYAVDYELALLESFDGAAWEEL